MHVRPARARQRARARDFLSEIPRVARRKTNAVENELLASAGAAVRAKATEAAQFCEGYAGRMQ
jgi:hypothetical protein